MFSGRKKDVPDAVVTDCVVLMAEDRREADAPANVQRRHDFRLPRLAAIHPVDRIDERIRRVDQRACVNSTRSVIRLRSFAVLLSARNHRPILRTLRARCEITAGLSVGRLQGVPGRPGQPPEGPPLRVHFACSHLPDDDVGLAPSNVTRPATTVIRTPRVRRSSRATLYGSADTTVKSA